MIRLVPRATSPWYLQVAASLSAIALTLLFGLLLFTLMGKPPLQVLGVFLTRPLSSMYDVSDILIKAGPLILIALGLAAGYRANIWNIGAEGQFILGAIGGMGAALLLGNPNSSYFLPLVLLSGALAGMAWAAIPAALRTGFNASELLTSLMLVYVAQQLLYYLVHRAWRNPLSFGWPETVALAPGLRLPVLVERTAIHGGLLIVLTAVAVLTVLHARTSFGYRMRIAETSPRALRFAGYRETSTIWLSLLLSGGLAGLAGAIELASTLGKLDDKATMGLGFTAIIVAFLGRLHPVGILFAGLLVAFTFVGGDWIKVSHNVDAAAADVFQASLLFFVLATSLMTRFRLQLRLRRPSREIPAE